VDCCADLHAVTLDEEFQDAELITSAVECADSGSLFHFSLQFACMCKPLIIRPKANIANTLWAKRTAFTRSAITPPKVN